LEEQVQQRKMGIMFRKPITKKMLLSSYDKETKMNTQDNIKMNLNEDENKLYADFCFRDLSFEHRVAFLDLLNKGKIDENTQIAFLDKPNRFLTLSSVLADRAIEKTAIHIDQHLYDSIKGKQEYKERKKKEHKKKTLKMYDVLDKVRKIVDRTETPKK